MIDFQGVKLWIFDLQQTLLNDFEAHLEAHKSILEEVDVEDVKAALDEVIRLWGMRVFDVYKQILGNRFSEEKLQELVERRDNRYIEIFKKSEPTLCKGVREMFDYLENKQLPIAVVSGIRRNLLEIGLTNAKLIQYVDFMVGADDVEHGKPNPEPFLKTVNHFGLEPDNCVVVGDSFLDIEGANNGNIPSIGVLTGFTSKEKLLESGADMVVQDLQELLKTIQRK